MHAVPKGPQQRVQPVQERSRKKINAILDAAALLLQKHGIEAVSTTSIAEQAGIPPGTVYHYFDNRLAVIAALAKRTIGEVDAGLADVLLTELSGPVPDWRAVLEGIFRAYAQSPGYVAVLTTIRAEPTLQLLARESNQRTADMLASVLAARTHQPLERARRIAWIMSECTDTVLQAALMANEAEAAALLDELCAIVEILFTHYSR